MIPKKPAPDLIRGGNRFSDKIMLKKRTFIALAGGLRKRGAEVLNRHLLQTCERPRD